MRKILCSFTLPLLLLLSDSSGNSAPQSPEKGLEGQTGTLERMIVASGNVAIDLDLNRLNGSDFATKEVKRATFRFEIGPNSFFTVRVFNHVLRGPEQGSMALRNSGVLPEPLDASSNQLVIEKIPSGEPFELVVRDGKTGFVFFNIEGHLYEYDAAMHFFSIKGGRLLISEELANKLGRPAEVNAVVGGISIGATMYPIEVTTVVNGAAKSSILPPRGGRSPNAPAFVPGPDIIVGDMSGLAQFGSSGTQVGLGIGTTSCNNGDQEVHFFQLPNTDHSVVSQNLYRMSGGASNSDRFEQIGQSWVKHTFGADQENACGFGCTPASDFTTLGVGCSDPYAASQNADQTDHVGALGSRAWVNPFTGAFPGSNPRPENHTGHVHTGTSHRILVEASDLNTTMNSGATYYAEVQYDSPHEYAWCQAHPGQCNMYNNASYRRYSVTGTTSFTFSAVGSTVRMTPATDAWTGATSNTIEPAPGVDGRAFVVYKVTNPSAGVWHYEYAIHNQNLDRSIQSFSVPLGCGVTVSNPGFHAPPNHPGFANDGTLGDAGFSNAAWTSNQNFAALSWNTETFAQNQNANAIRFGTLYNFRFDSNRPPQAANATIGFFKTGNPITVGIQGPTPDTCNPLQILSAASRKTHGGAGDFDIDLPLTGEPGVECRSGGGNHSLVVTFSNTMVSGNASMTSGTGNVAGSPTFSGNTMTIQLTGVTDVQKITVTLSNVTDSFSQVLPDTTVSMNVLMGDATGNKLVNSSDVSVVKSQGGQPITGSNFREDITADGSINSSDISLTKSAVGHGVP
jgi:hypothetical protein